MIANVQLWQTMKHSPQRARSFVMFTTILLAVLINGCGKQESAAPPSENNPANSTPASDQPAAPAANRAAAPASTDAAASLAAAQAAMQAKDYERAAAALLAVQQQRQPMTAEQGQALRDQMVLLQQNLAAGVASGDPKAKAAADLLRKSTMR